MADGAIVAVSAARTALPAPLLDVEASHTLSIGVIKPPPDIRLIVDKTAQFVARNGAWRAGMGHSSGV